MRDVPSSSVQEDVASTGSNLDIPVADPTSQNLDEQNYVTEPGSQEAPPLSFGERLVGKTFNPSGDPTVDRLKALFAEAADIVNTHMSMRAFPTENPDIKPLIGGGAVMAILQAQMMAVKVVTLK